MLSPDQIASLKAGIPSANANMASSSAPATHDWVDSLSAPDQTAAPQENIAEKIGDHVAPGVVPAIEQGFQNVKKVAPIANGIARGVLRPVASTLMNLQNFGETAAGKPVTQQAPETGLTKYIEGDGQGPITRVGQKFDPAQGLTKDNIGAVKDSIGTGLEIGTLAGGGGAAADVAETGIKGAIRTAVVNGLKQGAVVGGAQGLGGALHENSGLVDTLVKTLIGALAGSATFGAFGGVSSLANPEIQSAIGDTVSSAADAATNKVKGALTTSPEAQATAQTADELQKIKDTISPKPTAKEAKLATDQGRLIKGQDPTLFKAGTPDQIATSPQQLQSTMTIHRLIPDAANIDEPTLHAALDEKIADTAQKLKPQMEATPIKPETVQKITDDWTNLKKTQMQTADATDEPNVLKSQKQFEAILKKSSSGNMNDLWDSAKVYDASVPDNVKSANSISSESLQNKKAIWMQNRSILRNAINDSENGLGKTSQQAFSDMKDMYEAQNGIMSKAKIETEAAPSKFSQLADSKPVKIAEQTGRVLLGGAGVYETGKKLLTGSF